MDITAIFRPNPSAVTVTNVNCSGITQTGLDVSQTATVLDGILTV